MTAVPNPLLKITKYVSKKAKYARERDTITPRNGCELVVGVVARISGGPRQKELSLDDQVDHAVEVVSEHYAGPVELRVVATKGKGEDLQRPELVVIQHQLRTRELDLLICEDIGRIIRGADAVKFVGIAVDHGTRVLAPNDCFDSADADWETDLLSSCRDHVGSNSQTSKRIKQKKMNRFRKFGGATPCEIAGYVKPADATTYDDWRKVDGDTPVIREGLRLLKETLNCSRVARYFNEQRFKPGPYSHRKEWDGKMTRRFYKNTLLAGRPGRGFLHTVKNYEEGRRKSEPNPVGPDFIERPHLAHVELHELLEVNELLRQRNSKLGRKKLNGIDPRFRVPRKTTVFPSQHARCWYCGCHYVRGANGIIGNCMCTNSREWHCWNSIGVPCELAATSVMGALLTLLNEVEGFDTQFRDLVQQAHHDRVGTSAEKWTMLEADEKKLNFQMNNLVNSMTEYGPTLEIKIKNEELKQRQLQLTIERHRLENASRHDLRLPESVAELREAFEKQSHGLAIESPTFGDLMRLVAPEFHVFLVRLVDGGHLMPRARVMLDLRGCISDLVFVPGLSPLLKRVVTLDLFMPPQRERIREEAVRLASSGVYQRDIATNLSEPTFQAVVQKALKLDRMMKEQGLSTPYEVMTEPPADYPKLRRHQNIRYEFKPLDGYERPQI